MVGEDAIKYGEQYEKCIGLSMTLDDGVTPIPSFIKFSPLTRRVTISPAPADIGVYNL